MNNIPEPLLKIMNHLKEMIIIWKENGIDFDKPFSVIFKFYRANKTPPKALINYLEKEGYSVMGKQTRTLIIFKGYKISAEITKRWTEESLLETTKNLAIKANENETTLEDFLASENK